MTVQNLEIVLSQLGVSLPKNIKTDISMNLSKNNYLNKHFAFLIDLKTHQIIAYDFNIYFKSDSFPFSVHAEIQTITKYYKSKSMSKGKKVLFVAKLSRTGIVGNSRCCLNCMRFIRNNMDNLNLKKIYYSDRDNKLIELSKDDLIDKSFKFSKGYMTRY